MVDVLLQARKGCLIAIDHDVSSIRSHRQADPYCKRKQATEGYLFKPPVALRVTRRHEITFHIEVTSSISKFYLHTCILTTANQFCRGAPYYRRYLIALRLGSSFLASPERISCRCPVVPICKILARSRHIDRFTRPADLSGTRHRDVSWTFFFVRIGTGGL
jgi:hypothetical protein